MKPDLDPARERLWRRVHDALDARRDPRDDAQLAAARAADPRLDAELARLEARLALLGEGAPAPAQPHETPAPAQSLETPAPAARAWPVAPLAAVAAAAAVLAALAGALRGGADGAPADAPAPPRSRVLSARLEVVRDDGRERRVRVWDGARVTEQRLLTACAPPDAGTTLPRIATARVAWTRTETTP